ncbi:MAG: class I SAM-dependent methyltransferase [Butyrivibrio sp.]|nr:class I SAM-dependent methyltransferase [Butyrivibrio sp.]
MENEIKLPQLSRRLQTIAETVTPGMRVADIGTDHGFVPIYLVLKNIVPKAIAMDVRRGPLDRAKEHVTEYGLSQKIDLRLSDGMEKLMENEADTVICAGMGGPLMQRIVEEGRPCEKGIKEMILQPQSELMEFRRFLRDNKYDVLTEKSLEEDGKYYFLIKVSCANTDKQPIYTDMINEIISKYSCSYETALRICDRFGPFLLKQRSETLKAYLEHGKEVASSIIKALPENMKGERRAEVLQELEDIEKAIGLWD